MVIHRPEGCAALALTHAVDMLSAVPALAWLPLLESKMHSHQELHWCHICSTAPSTLGVRPFDKCRQLGDAAISVVEFQMVD